MIVGDTAARADKTRALRDVYVALAILVMAWVGCRMYLPAFRAGGGRALSYYDEFAPAVMLTCGRGLVNPWPHSSPALDTFLSERSDSFKCAQLDTRSVDLPLDSFQSVTRNLLLASAAVWRVTGISWVALDNLAALMFGITLATAYLVMRLIVGRVLAIVGVVSWAISPMHLENVAHLRDYSKAPFFVVTALAIALAIRIRQPKSLIVLGAAFGLVQGIGLGMRTDVILNFAPFLLVLFAMGGGDVRKAVSWKLAAAATSLLLFLVVAWPVLAVYRRSEGLWHVSLLGLTTPFDAALNLRRAPYDFGYLYDDSYISTVVQAYWSRVHSHVSDLLSAPGSYDRAAKAYYQLIASTFPADLLTRMAGSALHVLNLPFSISYGVVPLGITNPVMSWLGHVRTYVMLALVGVGPLAAAWLLVLIGMRDRIAACVAFVLLMFWACYPYLQFHERHVFHLEILTILVLLWAARLSWLTVAAVRADVAWATGRRMLWSASLLAGLVGCCVIAVAIAREMQEPRAHEVFAQYANAAEEPVEVQRASAAADVVRLEPALFDVAAAPQRIQQAMLVLDVTSACGPHEVSVHVRYEGTGATDFSRDLTVAVGSKGASSRAFLPVYSLERADGVSRFVSVDIPAAAAPCLRLARARELERVPLMLDAVLSRDWQSQPLAQQLYIGPILPERVWLRVARWWPRVAGLG